MKSLIAIVFIALSAAVSFGQQTAFQYQGLILDNGSVVSGRQDLIVILHSHATDPTQVGNSIEIPDVGVTAGQFNAILNFGPMPFTYNEGLYVEIRFRAAGTGDPYVMSSYRAPLFPAPYSIRSHLSTTAGHAVTADSVQGIYPTEIVQNDRTGTPQPGVSINVAGGVSGSSVNTTGSYNINGRSVLSSSNGNLYAGELAGRNSIAAFLGNSFFGTNAGNKNVNGSFNSYFGYSAGSLSASNSNSFFGYYAGAHNSTGGSNSFFGASAGTSTSSGGDNVFVGKSSAINNSSGSYNAIIGSMAGENLSVGNGNSFYGFNAGRSAGNENYNTLVGNRADIRKGVTNSTAIGNLARVDVSNAVVLGGVAGVNGAETSTKVGIGTSAPQNALHVIDRGSTGLRVQTDKSGGTVASFGGNGALQVDAPGIAGGRLNIQENGNTGIGTPAPAAKLHVNGTVRVDNGDILALGGSGIVLRNVYGQCFRLEVNQSAQLIITGIFCP